MRKLWIILVFLFLAACSSSSDEAPVPQDDTDTGPTVAEDLQPISVLVNADRPLIGVLQESASFFSSTTGNIETEQDESKVLNALILPAFVGTEPSTNFTNPDDEGDLSADIVVGTEEFSIDLAVSSTLPLGAQGACFGLDSWQGIITEELCTNALNSYVINFTSDKIQKENLRINVYSQNGEPGDFLVSDEIPSHRIRYKQISNINVSGSDQISKIFDFRGSLYFISSHSGFEKMYKFESGLFSQVSDIFSGDDEITAIAKDDTALYFQARSALGTKIYAYSGITGAGIKQVSNLNAFGGDSLLNEMSILDDRLYFVSSENPAGEDRLMYYNGAVIDAIDQDLYAAGVDEISYVKAAANAVYFQGLDTNGLKKMWRYDPVFNSGVGRIEKITGLYDGFDDEVRDIEELNNFIYFVGKNSIGREKLFQLDPSTKSSKQLSSTNVIGSDNILEFKILGGKLFLSARNTAGQQKPFMYDPAQSLFFQLTDFFAGNEDPENFTLYGEFIYFTIKINSDGHQKLFLFDQNSNTIIQVADLNQNGSDNIGNLTVVNSVLYFTGEVNGNQKLFRLCDESTGCIN